LARADPSGRTIEDPAIQGEAAVGAFLLGQHPAAVTRFELSHVGEAAEDAS